MEILGDRSKAGIENGLLYAVSPLSVTCSHQIIADCPGIVSNVACLMAGERIVACKSLCAGVHAVNQHVRSLHLIISLESGLEISLLTCMHIQDHRNLHELVHGHAMHMELGVIQTAFLSEG